LSNIQVDRWWFEANAKAATSRSTPNRAPDLCTVFILLPRKAIVDAFFYLIADLNPETITAIPFVISAIYQLAFRGNRMVEGWQLAAIVQSQSGNPVNFLRRVIKNEFLNRSRN